MKNYRQMEVVGVKVVFLVVKAGNIISLEHEPESAAKMAHANGAEAIMACKVEEVFLKEGYEGFEFMDDSDPSKH